MGEGRTNSKGGELNDFLEVLNLFNSIDKTKVLRFTSLTNGAPDAFETNFFHHGFWADCDRLNLTNVRSNLLVRLSLEGDQFPQETPFLKHQTFPVRTLYLSPLAVCSNHSKRILLALKRDEPREKKGSSSENKNDNP